jgi:hypothetical protein
MCITNLQVTKRCEGLEVHIHTFLTSVVYGGEFDSRTVRQRPVDRTLDGLQTVCTLPCRRPKSDSSLIHLVPHNDQALATS